jgi:hypothetical protein
MAHSDFPVKHPLITDVLARSIHREMMTAERKRFAYPTWFRHSDAGKCGRYLWFEHEKVDQSNPPDVSSAWVMWIGTMLHEELQRALPERFPDAQVEVPVRHDSLSSGHLDAVITLDDGTKVCYELKTRGSFGFDKAVGWRRKNFSTQMPEGPTSSDRIQGALNATAMDADLLVIGMMGLESASKGFAEKNGIDDLGRSVAEWHFSKQEFGPWAMNEMHRLEGIRLVMNKGHIPPREAIGDEMETVKLNPNASKVDWRCQYCGHFDTCRKDES